MKALELKIEDEIFFIYVREDEYLITIFRKNSDSYVLFHDEIVSGKLNEMSAIHVSKKMDRTKSELDNYLPLYRKALKAFDKLNILL